MPATWLRTQACEILKQLKPEYKPPAPTTEVAVAARSLWQQKSASSLSRNASSQPPASRQGTGSLRLAGVIGQLQDGSSPLNQPSTRTKPSSKRNATSITLPVEKAPSVASSNGMQQRQHIERSASLVSGAKLRKSTALPTAPSGPPSSRRGPGKASGPALPTASIGTPPSSRRSTAKSAGASGNKKPSARPTRVP